MPLNVLYVEGILISFNIKNQNAKNVIFFFHGNSASAEYWENQLNEDRFSAYCLIAFDLPGQGKSSASPDPENHYSLLAFGRIMVNAVKQLVNDRAFQFVGLSLGTNIIAEMLAYGLRPCGISLIAPNIIGDGFPIEKAQQPEVDLTCLSFDEVTLTNLLETVKKAVFNQTEKNISLITNSFYKADCRFRSSMFKNFLAGKVSDEIKLLKKCEVPLLMIFGEEEMLLDIHYLDDAPLLLWHDQFFYVPKAGHFVILDQPEHTNILLALYIEERFKEVHS